MKIDQRYKRINKIPLKYIPMMVLASLSINLLSLALPLTMKQIYGKVVLEKSVETLNVLLLGCVVALILEALLRKTKEVSSKWIASKYEHTLSKYLIQKLLSANENSKPDNYSANLEKFNSISRVTGFYATSYYQLFVDLPFMLLFLYLIYYLGGILVAAPLVLSVIYISIMAINAQLYFSHREAQISASDQVMIQLTETLEKIHLIKAAGLEEFQISKFRKALNRSTETSFKTNRYQMLPEIMSSYLSQLTLFAILTGGGYLIPACKVINRLFVFYSLLPKQYK